MTCTHVNINGVRAIICGPRKLPVCCKCGGLADRLCDWKVAKGKDCDRPICSSCSHKPAKEKDLCPQHAEAWAKHPRNGLALEYEREVAEASRQGSLL